MILVTANSQTVTASDKSDDSITGASGAVAVSTSGPVDPKPVIQVETPLTVEENHSTPRLLGDRFGSGEGLRPKTRKQICLPSVSPLMREVFTNADERLDQPGGEKVSGIVVKLQLLNLRGCAKVTDAGLKELAAL